MPISLTRVRTFSRLPLVWAGGRKIRSIPSLIHISGPDSGANGESDRSMRRDRFTPAAPTGA